MRYSLLNRPYNDLPTWKLTHLEAMTFGTLQPIGSVKCAMILKGSLPYCLWRVRPSYLNQQIDVMMPEQTSEQGASGDGSKVHFLTYGFFTVMHQATATPASQQCTEGMSKPKRENMVIESVKSKWLRSPHWSLPPLETWAEKPLLSTGALLI